MFDKRLLAFAAGAKKYIAASVGLQWIALLANVALIAALGLFLQQVLGASVGTGGEIAGWMIAAVIGIAIASIIIRMICTTYAQRMGAKAANIAKTTIRRLFMTSWSAWDLLIPVMLLPVKQCRLAWMVQNS